MSVFHWLLIQVGIKGFFVALGSEQIYFDPSRSGRSGFLSGINICFCGSAVVSKVLM